MEEPWKMLSVYLGLILCELCNGLPINLEDTVADSHTQLLTGLVAILLTVCSVVFLAGCLCCQRRNGFKVFRDSPVVASTASNLDHGHINPVANGEFTIFTPLSPPHHNNNVFLANQQLITRTQEDYVCGDVDVSSWFNGTETDFPRIKLKYIKEIGKGWFGRVVEGAAQDVDVDNNWTPVVVRILEATASSRERVVFLHDAAIYRCGEHPNILKLFGRCLDTIPLLLLQEYCTLGDLKNYLLQSQNNPDKLFSSEHPLMWCCQLTAALKHLHENKITHPDLAARNCQLSDNLILKLGDYGLAVFQYPDDYYQGAPGVSVRWSAPESVSYTSTTIEAKKITFEANVWSLAVTMWEICACGEQPYSTLSDDEVVSDVLGSQKIRLDRPKYQTMYTDYLFRLMQHCWTSSECRPSASQIDLMLGELLQVHKNTKSSSDFDKRWESFKPNNIVKRDNRDDETIATTKPLSPSLNNLHGSLDNLIESDQMESWLENVATKTGDMSYVKGLSDAIKDLDNAIALETSTSSDSSLNPKLEFKLGPEPNFAESPNPNDSLTDSSLFAQRSSGSETEEENWKKKIERGAYTEKVRQKSRSVADLMVLTHIDPSESESETPLPSLNYKNVRLGKQNLETSLKFGSEGNLLNVQDTFQEELKKLQEERRDSLLFVPENNSLLKDSKRIFDELNSTSEIKPTNQVFNVFNVTIDKYSPVRIKPSLDELINLDRKFEVPKLSEIIRSNYLSDKMSDDDNMYDSGVEGDRVESTESLKNVAPSTLHQVPKLVDLIQDNDELMDYIIAKYETESLSKSDENLDTVLTPLEVQEHKVAFDLSEGQELTMPNSLTHSNICTSTPFGKKSLQEVPREDNFTSLNLFSEESAQMYSLETWDNFLGKALDQSDSQELFDSFTSEPQSLLFTETEINETKALPEETYICKDKNETYVCEDNKEGTFSVDVNDINVELEDDTKNGSWESGGGWFLHPPTNAEVTGEMTISNGNGDSYVGFNVDDEIMAAIRTELINKLPQAQGGTNGTVHDEEEWDSVERNEVFLRYNVYNTPLSPIPEESLVEDSCTDTSRQHNGEEDSDWSDREEMESQSAHTVGSSVQLEHPHRHTPSQDSCCSNDTLFNLEELTCAGAESPVHVPVRSAATEPEAHVENDEKVDRRSVDEFLEKERAHCVRIEETLANEKKSNEAVEEANSNSESTDRLVPFSSKPVAPLPSPEDKPWKQLPASLLSYDTVTQNVLVPDGDEDARCEEVTNLDDIYNEADYVNIVNMENTKNAVNSSKQQQQLEMSEAIDDRDSPTYVNNSLIIDNSGSGGDEERDIFGVLTDIRFSGPSDSQLMSTSFSESNDPNDDNDQDWDSGSDTRSSSSGEFIWKEGEHEESLKALRAAPQDVLEDVHPMEDIQEETSSDSSDTDDDGESPEFVPSAWDKFATPTKSALRSPEKTLEKTEKKKSKGVWFKKQKYHCVYEYPREPESPVLHSYDLWKPQPDYSSLDNWELDGSEPYVPADNSDEFDISQPFYKPKPHINIYQLSNINDAGLDDEFYISSSTKPFDMITGLTSQFFPGNWPELVKTSENATPDSGVEDITPGLEHEFLPRVKSVQPLQILAAEAVKRNKKAEELRKNEVLGGLRHTRNKLKLDLPPSPSAFTSCKIFNIETPMEPVVIREKPTFTTFGKSRFLVQHVDTPPDNEANRSKNVSFEALPYKPLQTQVIKEDYDDSRSKGKVEIVRGEASLLDSADEDSGIESSTLERKTSNAV